jgi:hypothetical protein
MHPKTAAKVLLLILVTAAGNGSASAQTPLVEMRALSFHELREQGFSLASPQEVTIEATGAESTSRNQYTSWFPASWRSEPEGPRPWSGNAWILDLRTRQVVWELRQASTTDGRRDMKLFSGRVKLPAGSYGAFYAAFPDGGYYTNRDGVKKLDLNRQGRDALAQFALTIRAAGDRLSSDDVKRLDDSTRSGAAVVVRGVGPERYSQTGFELARPTEITVDAAGEIREDGEFDSGWIIDATSHKTIWKLTWKNSGPAGGAPKNRVAHETLKLPAGRYAAFYATDDSHDPSEWNSPPPFDPAAWGLTIRASSDAALKPFAYEHVPEKATIVALTKMGDGESRTRGFTLTRPLDVRIYAMGEGRDGRMFDYAWLTTSSSTRRVWEMRYDDTTSAGGDPKNRLVDTVLHLDKGSYVLHYISDDSHSYGDWNASAPADGAHWGATVLAASGTLDSSAIAPYEEKPDPLLIAQVVRMRDSDDGSRRFSLDRETAVRIYALGEGTSGEMHDYGWIEDARTGRTVWELTYRMTEHGGGAQKNRRFDGVIKLPAGEYVLRYRTDGSHSFGSWNADPPEDPEAWGISVYRALAESGR